MTKFPLLALLVASALLVSCSSSPPKADAERGKDQRSDDENSLFSSRSSKGKPLAVPPDLLESSNDKVKSNSSEADSSGEFRVLPEVVGAAIKSDGGQSWLEIEADVEVVWRRLTEFWAYEGIQLVDFSPESGVMETDWFVKKDKTSSSKGFGAVAGSLFNTFTQRRTALDKFNIRLERNDTSKTRLFVTHRSIKNIVKEYNNNWKDPEYKWVEMEEDPDKVAELLQTIVLLFDTGNDGSA